MKLQEAMLMGEKVSQVGEKAKNLKRKTYHYRREMAGNLLFGKGGGGRRH